MVMKCIKLFLFILLGLFVFSLDVKAEGCSAYCRYEFHGYDNSSSIVVLGFVKKQTATAILATIAATTIQKAGFL